MNAEPAASELHQAFADPFLSYVNSTTTLGIHDSPLEEARFEASVP
jgi:hypothetical protein